jgi:eukaryotic-like serine/threonine-protein kinase
VTDPIAGLNAALADRYVIDRELGRGGMATVYLARDLKHERFVALKTLRPEIAMALGRERFLREIKLAARLQHPNILAVYDSGDAGGVLYYVMPFVEGESLRERLEREPQLPLDDALQIAREVADALSYAHGHDVVHRDIKPENIMLSGGHAIVTDFGIARAVSAAGGDKLTETGLAIGTPAYMSPEQASGMGQVDRRSDIYSLGCVLYETLAGQPPFTGPTAQAIMARHSLDSVPRLRIVRAAIPDELEQVINRALEKVPADRYQTAAQFAEAIAVASTGRVSPVTARARPAATSPRWFGVPRGVVVGVAVGVIVVAGWVTRSLWSRNAHADGSTGGLDSRRIAVLYFQDLSQDSSLGYVSDGLTEALIDQLSQVRSLDVISRNGVSPYRNSELPRDSIARALGVGTLVEGSVEPIRDRMRITVRLVDGASGADLLQRASFEQPARNLLAIRDTLAGEVARVLRERLGEEVRLRAERAGTDNPAAWSLMQQAERALKTARAAGIDDASAAAQYARADSLLQGAEELDHDWVDPVVGRARVAYLRARLERAPREMDRFFQVGLAHSERALRMDSRSPDALEIRGTIRYQRFLRGLEPDAAAAERLLGEARADLEGATRLNANQVGAWTTLSHLYYNTREFVEANRAARTAYEADAYLSGTDNILYRLFVTSYDLELFQPALDWCDTGRRRFPNDPRFVECRLMLLATKALDADVAEAWRLSAEAVRLVPERDRPFKQLLEPIYVAAVLGRAGLKDSARHVLERSRGTAAVDPTRDLLGWEASVRTMLGDKEEAIRLLGEWLVANPRHREGFRKSVHWWWRPLQDDPRFKALIGAR